jgi:hypothetical protein
VSRSWVIGWHARRLQEGSQLAAVRSQQTQDIVDDTFALWRDSRAAQYLAAFADPQSLTFPEIIRVLQELGEQLGQLSNAAAECENGVNTIRSESAELESVWLRCNEACVNTGYWAHDARSRAGEATSTAERIAAAVAEHQHPPV